MSEQDFLEEDADSEDLLGELDSLKDLLGTEEEPDAAGADPAEDKPDADRQPDPAEPPDPTTSGPEESDLDAFLDDQGGASAASAGSAGAADDQGGASAASAGSAGAADAGGPEDDVPLLDEVVFRGDDVPGEAIELMSAMRTAPEADASQASADETAPRPGAAAEAGTPPADPAELEALVEAAVDRRLHGLREELKAELLAALRERSGRD